MNMCGQRKNDQKPKMKKGDCRRLSKSNWIDHRSMSISLGHSCHTNELPTIFRSADDAIFSRESKKKTQEEGITRGCTGCRENRGPRNPQSRRDKGEVMATQWTCPYCNRPCTIGDSDVSNISKDGFISDEYGHYYCVTTIVVCPNPHCRQQTVSLRIYEYFPKQYSTGKTLFQWKLLPESEAKPFPGYIPLQILNDYREACLIRNKSPKASATLSRRCLQGIIRDFWQIKKSRLVDEINELQDKIDPITWDAINSVRHVGNIGAHMEKDVNLIIDVEPEEAGLLIWLIETLLTDWYITRYEREQRMSGLVKLAEKKKQEKSQPAAADGQAAAP